ncbi:hypothetical protein [Sphingomonas bacterium]|uniref:hypothetical protein n=1 Tax=Sphingomonas bacterium TaxID=1895847 RepID=UPI001576657B|nr:hypothetical protein [Sphingomonas bacterium]
MRHPELVLAVLVILGASSPKDQKGSTDRLSITDRSGNALKLARFVRQQCVGAVTDLNRFEAILKASGWPAVRKQTANPSNQLSLDVWQLPYLELIRGQPVTGRVWTCSVAIDGRIAPSTGAAKAALSSFAGYSVSPSGEWAWSSSRGNRLHMTLGQGPNNGLLINIEDTQLPWWQTILG